MRRTTAGVLSSEQVLAHRIRRAEADEPERVIARLEPFVLERRRERLREVIGKRLGSVVVLLDAPYDPHNGAAIVRTCEAFGVQQLHVVERADVPFLVAGSVARGSERWLDIAHYGTAADALEVLSGSTLVAAEAEGGLVPEELAAIPRLTLVLGNERTGIGPALRSACSKAVRVPMRGFVESLNVSVTAAILLHAATRGREGDLDQATRRRLYARGLYLSLSHAAEILDA
jgi:tRNA (guanosine-2'-O-)-methyltransferase